MATEYIVSGNLRHNDTDYADGSTFSTDDKTLEAALRRAGTLLTLEEYHRQAEANTDVAAVARALTLRDQQASASAAKDDEIERLRAELEAAKAQSADAETKSEADSGEETQPGEDNA